MQTRPTWTVVDVVHHKKNVLIVKVVVIPLIVLAVSVHQTNVKASIVTSSLKYWILHIVVPTCNDTIKNANETDVDCGGSCLSIKRCEETLKCINSDDCITGVCRSNICQGECSH